jgi:methyl-accepting chemotaxis protein
VKITLKIWVACFVITFVILLYGGVTYFQISQQRQLLTDIFAHYARNQESTSSADRITRVHQNLYKGLSWVYAQYNEKQIHALFEEQVAEITRLSGEIKGYKARTPAEKASYSDLARELDEYLKWVKDVQSMAEADLNTATMFMGSAEKSYAELGKVLEQLRREDDRQSADLREKALASMSLLTAVTIICLLLSMGASSVVGLFLSHVIARPLRRTTRLMQDIAAGDGDLTRRLDVTGTDEIGDIAHWFNQIIVRIEGLISSLKNSAVQVDAATQEVYSGSMSLSQTTQEQASAIEEVAATIAQMTSSIKENSISMTQGWEKVQAIVQMANQSDADSQELFKGMGEISIASKKIGDIIATVKDVAFQTNLLALNAAVEAARAGEHGKGFAVVADEVRSLAQRSAEAAKQVKDLIEDTVEKVSVGDELMKKSRESIEKIISCISDLSQTIDQVVTASAEQATGVEELNRAVEQIDSTTQQNSSTVEQLASTSERLNTEAKGLSEIVGRFKVSEGDSLPEGPGRTPAFSTDVEQDDALAGLDDKFEF